MRILDLCSELSSIAVGGETDAQVPYSVPSLLKTPSSNHVAKGFKMGANESHGEDSLLHNQGSKDTSGSSRMTSVFHSFYSSHVSEDSGGASVNNQEDEASITVRYVNSISNGSCQDLKFQNPAKSDRIYVSSRSFSNEEIVEHLRRIDDDDDDDDDDNLHNYDEDSVLDAVESSIISNIMSIDFDSCEDYLPMPNGLSELLEEADGLGGSSWSSLNSDQSVYSFTHQDGFASPMAASILPECGDYKEQCLCKPQYPVSRAQSLAPPGFSMPSRDPPPWFSNSDRTSSLPRPSSGGRVANAASFSSALFQPSSVSHGSSFDDVDFFDRANKPHGGLNAFDDESRFWLMMQQSTPKHQDSKFSQIFAHQIPISQQEPRFAGCHKVNAMSELDQVCGLSSRLVNERRNCDPYFFTPMPPQKGHVSNTNGYLHSLDLLYSSGDVYTRVFGL